MNGLTLPGGYNVPNTRGLNPQFQDLGSIVSAFLSLAIEMGFVLMFIWMVIGVMQFFINAGNKEQIAHARKRIVSALIGFILVAIALLLQQFVEGIFKLQGVTVTNITSFNSFLVTPAYADTVNLAQQYDFGSINSLGEGLTTLTPILFQMAAVVLIFFILFGAIRWIISAGNKEAVAGARSMITNAVIGFIMLMIIFVVVQAIPNLLGLTGLTIIK